MNRLPAEPTLGPSTQERFREVFSKRTRMGLAKARAKGRSGGPRPRRSPAQRATLPIAMSAFDDKIMRPLPIRDP